MEKLIKRIELASAKEAIKELKKQKKGKFYYEKSNNQKDFFIGYDRLLPLTNKN